jgi:hypothetical protein
MTAQKRLATVQKMATTAKEAPLSGIAVFKTRRSYRHFAAGELSPEKADAVHKAIEMANVIPAPFGNKSHVVKYGKDLGE